MSVFGKDGQGKKPRLQNLDDMFGIDGSETAASTKNVVTSVPISELTAFNGHPFRLYEGERLDDMIASIKDNGVLVPILVRKTDDVLEILAGHNRANASKLAGLMEIPAIILENISDDEAMVYVIETNLLQRSFSDMSHSEKATVIALHHSKMFSQGKRNDILEQVKRFEGKRVLHSGDIELTTETSSSAGQRMTSREAVAKEYGLTRNTVARYLRINQLLPALKTRLDNGEFSFIPAVTLSFLKQDEQEMLNDCMERNELTVDMKKADALREFSENSNLNCESLYRILSGENISKSIHIPTVKIRNEVYSKYFNADHTKDEVQDVVEKALAVYFSGSWVPNAEDKEQSDTFANKELSNYV